jgi:phage gpG-like protein
MIQIDGADVVQFDVPDVDLLPAMQECEELMYASVMQNFDVGGRPVTWQPLKKGGPSHLRQSGAMQGSVRHSSSQEGGTAIAEVWIPSGAIPYAAIHQHGGVIEHPGSSKFQAFQVGGVWVYTHGTRAHKIPISARPYMMFQEVDIQRCKEIIGNRVLEFFQSTQNKRRRAA